MTYDIASFEPRSIFMYPGDGWGLTHDEHRLIMSDGSSKLRFLDPETFAELGRLEVFDGDKPVEYLNELEFVDGKIYANVQPQDRIAIIQPDSGQVTGWIDLAGTEIAHAAASHRASASRHEWHCLRRCGPQAVCDRQALAKSL